MSERFARLSRLSESERTKTLLSLLKDYHQPSYRHSLDVARLAFKIAMNDSSLTQQEQKLIYKTALLHDIGKLDVPTWILSRGKETILSEADRALLKAHGKIGKKRLDDLGYEAIYGIVSDQHNIGIDKYPPQEEELKNRHPLVPYISLADLVVSSLDSSRLHQPNYRPVRIILDAHNRFAKGYFAPALREPFDKTIAREFPHITRQLPMIKYGK